MRSVKSKNTAPELIVRKLLFRNGFRYRIHATHLAGKPDIVFTKKKKVIFVHGCFWHGHDCKRGIRMPATNSGYWRDKIVKNKLRDIKNKHALEAAGWSVLILWECEIKDEGLLIRRLSAFLCG